MKMCSTSARLASSLATIGAMVIGGAHAAGQTREELLAWAEAERPKDVDRSLLYGKVFTYHREYYYIPSQSEMKALREEVAGRPEHHERRRLEWYERRMREGTLIDPTQYWCIDAERWRVVDDAAEVPARGDGPYYIDSAVGARDAWIMNPRGTLQVMDAGAGNEGNQPAAKSMNGDPLFMFDVLVGSPLSIVVRGLGEPDVRIADGKWTMVHRAKRAGMLHTTTGRWEGGRGIVETAAWTYPPELPQTATTYHFGPRIWCESIGREVYENVRMTSTPPGGHYFDPEFLVVFDSIEPIPPSTDLEALVAVPTDGGIDPIRGKLRVKVVTDGRTSLSAAIAAVAVPTVGTGWPGWIVAASVCVAVVSVVLTVVIFLRRRIA